MLDPELVLELQDLYKENDYSKMLEVIGEKFPQIGEIFALVRKKEASQLTFFDQGVSLKVLLEAPAEILFIAGVVFMSMDDIKWTIALLGPFTEAWSKGAKKEPLNLCRFWWEMQAKCFQENRIEKNVWMV